MFTKLKMKVLSLSAQIFPVLLAVVPLLLVLVGLPALAQDAGVLDPNVTVLKDLQLPTDPTDLGQLAGVIVSAVMVGRYGLAVSLGVTLVITALRTWVPETTKFGAWMKTRLGAIVMNFGFSLGMAFGTAFLAHTTLTLDIALRAVQVALSAAGGWSIYKAIREELDEKKAAAAGAAAAATPSAVDEHLNK